MCINNGNKKKGYVCMLDLQKANLWKRISAALFDFILLGIVIVAVAFGLSALLKYDVYNEQLNDYYTAYEEKHGVTFEISSAEYYAMSEEEFKKYNDAYMDLISDEEAMYTYNMVINLTLLIVSLSILFGYLIMEFAVPLRLGNGQTLGKKIFGTAVMRVDSVKITAPLLFIRTVLGKFTIETMIPVLIVIMIYFNTIGVVGMLILGLILLLQIILYATSKTNSLIHDVLAKTVVVDYASQMIFETEEEMTAYKAKMHAEKAARQTY